MTTILKGQDAIDWARTTESTVSTDGTAGLAQPKHWRYVDQTSGDEIPKTAMGKS